MKLNSAKISSLKVYEIEKVTSGLCYIEDFIFLENKTVWIWNSLDVQSINSSVALFDILSYLRGFFNNFLHQLLEKSALFERNCKYTRFVCFDRWLGRYGHISANKILLHYWKSIFYIGYLYYLSVHCHSCCFCIISWRYERDYLHVSIDILFFVSY